jgi:hypothetical protein
MFQIAELNLDNCRSTSIVGLSDEFTNLETLSLINAGLTSLKGFPKLPNLKKVLVSDSLYLCQVHGICFVLLFSQGKCTLNFIVTSDKLYSSSQQLGTLF